MLTNIGLVPMGLTSDQTYSHSNPRFIIIKAKMNKPTRHTITYE